MATWPPELDELKALMKISDARDDARLSAQLAGAIAYVERVHSGRLDFLALGSPVLIPIDQAYVNGTLALARRWHERGRSPDGMVASADMGSVRMGSGDADIDRQLRIGRYALPVIA